MYDSMDGKGRAIDNVFNKSKQINILKNQNQFKTCVNLHQTKGEKYTLTKVIFCPANGGTSDCLLF